jgi:type II secretory pathway component PulF
MRGSLEAASPDSARKNLLRNFRHILELEAKVEVQRSLFRMPVQEVLFCTQQLSAMITAGISITEALEFLVNGDNPRMNAVMERVSRGVLAGKKLSLALSEYPLVFPKVYVSLVGAAEVSGKLHVVLAKLADLLERQTNIKKRLITVFVYPAMLVSMATVISCFIVFYIFPVLRPMFNQVGMDLPAPTRLLISVADSVHHPLPWVCLVALALGLVQVARSLWRVGSDSPGGLRYRFDYWLLRVPLIGKLLTQSLGARTLYALSLMLNSGMSVVEAFNVLETIVDNAYVRTQMRMAKNSIKEGELIEASLRKHKVFSRGALHMIRAGEESGRLDDMMKLVAEGYEMDLDLTIDRLGAVIEPVIMAIMGVIIGFICVAAILPIIKFVTQI